MDVLGIGECMIELDAVGPLAEATVLTRQVGGDVYNTLVGLSRLGHSAGFATRVAMDAFGSLLLRQFERHGLDTGLVKQQAEGWNGMYFASVLRDKSHEFVYYRRGSAASRMQPLDLADSDIQAAKLVYGTGVTLALSATARETVRRAFRLAKQSGRMTAFDPNYRPALWSNRMEARQTIRDLLTLTDIFLPSQADLSDLFGLRTLEESIAFFQRHPVPLVVIKQSEDGATLLYKGAQTHVSAWPVDVVMDTIGAGDAFNAGFLHGILSRQSLTDALQCGAITAALSTQERGPTLGLPSLERLQEMFPSPEAIKETI